MTYADFFNEMKSKFIGTDVSDIQEHLAYQFNIEDEEAGGIFYVEVKEGQLYVEPYEYYDRDAIFVANPEIFRQIAEGRLDPVHAFLTQQLKVEGNIDKALKLKDVIELKQKELKKKEAKEKAARKKEVKETAAAKKETGKKTAAKRGIASIKKK